MSAIKQDGRREAFGVLGMAIAGGLAFWVANFVISRTAIAAEYRAALSISYIPMLLESLVGGLVIGFFVAFVLFHFFDRIPAKDPILKSIILSLVALIFFTVAFEVPGTFLSSVNDAMRYFLIGTVFNAVRILALGVVIGFLCDRIGTRARQDARSVR
jgi:fructose-specific phosphotransferase system IIC component